MQNNAADQLDIKVAHIEDAPAGFAANGEGLYQQVVERLTVGDALFEVQRFRCKIGIRQLLQPRLEVVDSRDDGTKRLDFTFILGPKDFREDRIEHGAPITILTDL